VSRRPFDPGEIDRETGDLEPAATELERYAALTGTSEPVGLADRVMAAVEREPLPQRGFLAGLFATRMPLARVSRVAIYAAILVLVVGGVMAAGELARLVRDVSIGGPSSSPTESVAPTPTPSQESLSPAESSSPTESESPEASPETGGSPEATARSSGTGGTPEEEQTGSPSATPSATPKATSTPEPSATAHP